MARTIKGRDLTPGVTFIDPRREGRRPATVVEVTGCTEPKVFCVLNDENAWGAWTARYGLDEELELA